MGIKMPLIGLSLGSKKNHVCEMAVSTCLDPRVLSFPIPEMGVTVPMARVAAGSRSRAEACQASSAPGSGHVLRSAGPLLLCQNGFATLTIHLSKEGRPPACAIPSPDFFPLSSDLVSLTS